MACGVRAVFHGCEGSGTASGRFDREAQQDGRPPAAGGGGIRLPAGKVRQCGSGVPRSVL